MKTLTPMHILCDFKIHDLDYHDVNYVTAGIIKAKVKIIDVGKLFQ